MLGVIEMNYLDLYLQRNHCKRYDVYKKTGVSQQLLATHTKKKIEEYSTKIIIALSETLNKSPGKVLDELIALKIENPVFEAFNPSELLTGLNAKYDTIIVSGIYCNEIYKLMREQLSEKELMGMELGSAGLLTIFVYAIDAVRDHFSNDHNNDKDIEKKLKLYKIKEISSEKLILSLKQLEY